MSNRASAARRATPLPAAPTQYEHSQEQAFRLVLEQEIQTQYALVAGKAGLTGGNDFSGDQSGVFLDNGGAVYNVKKHGARGDDPVVDPVKIQECIDFAHESGGGIVEIPPPVDGDDYLIDGADKIIVRDGVYIVGSGRKSSIRRLTVPGSLVAVFEGPDGETLTNAGIRDVALLGPSYGTPVTVIDANASALSFRAVEGLDLSRLYIDGWDGTAIRLDGSSITGDPNKITIGFCWLNNCGRGLFAIHGPQDLIVVGNRVTQIGQAAIFIDDLSGSLTSYGPKPQRVIVSQNLVRDWGRIVGSSGIGLAATTAALVTNNVLEGGGNSGEAGLVISTGGNNNVGIQLCENTYAAGNVFKNIRGTSLALQGAINANIGPNTYINPGLGSGGVSSAALSIASAFNPEGDVETVSSGCTVFGQHIAYENGVADELLRGLWITSGQENNELLENKVFAGTNRIVDSGTNTRKFGNVTDPSAAPTYAANALEATAAGAGLIAASPDGTRYRLAPPNGGGAASWVAV